MALLPISDLNYRILFRLDPKNVLQMMLLNRPSYRLVTESLVYQYIIKLRNITPAYTFDSTNIITQYYLYGLVHILEQYQYYHPHGIYYAAMNGHTNVLDWCRKTNFEFWPDTDTIDWASANGHIHVLEWFKIHSIQPVLNASSEKQTKSSCYEFIYSDNAVDMASTHNHISVLEWWKNSTFEFKYSSCAIYGAFVKGNIDVLEWFRANRNHPALRSFTRLSPRR